MARIRRSYVRFRTLLMTALTGSVAVGASIRLMSEEILLAAEYRKHAKALRAAAKFDREDLLHVRVCL